MQLAEPYDAFLFNLIDAMWYLFLDSVHPSAQRSQLERHRIESNEPLFHDHPTS